MNSDIWKLPGYLSLILSVKKEQFWCGIAEEYPWVWRFLAESTHPVCREENLQTLLMSTTIFSQQCDHCVITSPCQIKTFPGHCCKKGLQKGWRHSHKCRQGAALCSFASSCQKQLWEQMKCKLQLCHTYFWDVMSWPKKDTNLFVFKKRQEHWPWRSDQV